MSNKTNPSTTTKTTQISIRIPNNVFHCLGSLCGDERTKWIISAIEEKIDRTIKDTTQSSTINPDDDLATNLIPLPKVTFKNVTDEAVAIIFDLTNKSMSHRAIAEKLNDSGLEMLNGNKFTANSSCIKNFERTVAKIKDKR